MDDEKLINRDDDIALKALQRALVEAKGKIDDLQLEKQELIYQNEMAGDFQRMGLGGSILAALAAKVITNPTKKVAIEKSREWADEFVSAWQVIIEAKAAAQTKANEEALEKRDKEGESDE